jgi:3',5'-cyclic AMP phosphodiesterase CpdA
MPIPSSRPFPAGATLLLGLLLGAGCADDSGSFAKPPGPPRLLVFSDPHYFAPSLGPTGTAFESYLAQDRKLLAESDAILRGMVALVEKEDPQFVLVPGDLTKDGERASHEAAAAYLRQMETAGRRVFVVPGNHDIQNDGAESYAGDTITQVPTISAAEFAALYAEAGYHEAIARDPTSLSYIAELEPGLWLLAIDSCIYGDVRGSSKVGGRLAQDTRAWIQGVLAAAQQAGIRVLAMMHHGLVEHFTNQTLLFADFVIQDRAAVAKLLADGGVTAVFTGHFHANDITRYVSAEQTRPIFDIETGSTVTYPCPYRVADVTADTLAITTKHVTSIDYDLGGKPDFPTLARDSLRLGLEELIIRLVQAPPYALSAERATTLAPWLADGLLAHYVGDEVMPAEASAEVQSLAATTGFYEQLAGVMLQSIWTDLPPPDNDVTIDLTAGTWR